MNETSNASRTEFLEYDVRRLRDDLSDLRRDVERYDDQILSLVNEQQADLQRLAAQVRALARLAGLPDGAAPGAAGDDRKPT